MSTDKPPPSDTSDQPQPPAWVPTPAPDVRVSTRAPKSRTWALRHLSKFFIRPFIRVCTTNEDKTAKVARWRVFCRHLRTGHEIGICEVAGPAEALPKAALVAACRLIKVIVTFDDNGGPAFAREPLKVPAPTCPSTDPAPTAE